MINYRFNPKKARLLSIVAILLVGFGLSTRGFANDQKAQRDKVKSVDSPGAADASGGQIILGTDERAPSNDEAVARLTPVGCTGWITYFGAILSAGHCDNKKIQFVEFNVPLSASNGSTNRSSEADRYFGYFDASENPDKGNDSDWGIMHAVRVGAVPGVYYGKFVRFAPLKVFGGQLYQLRVRVTGYGVDGPKPNYGNPAPENAYSQTQQSATGALVAATNLYPNAYQICHLVDTQPGNSGSPVEINGTTQAIGIHVAGSAGIDRACGSQMVNYATTLDEPHLVTAMQAFPGMRINPRVPGANIIFVDAGSLFTRQDGSVLGPFSGLGRGFSAALSKNTTALISLTAGVYNEPPLTLDLPTGTNVIVTLPVGDATLFQDLMEP